MDVHDENAIRTSLNILCDVFKENAGVFNYEIASAAGVDKTMLSKWRNGTANMSEICRLRLISYFSQEPFERYRPLIMDKIINIFEVQENGRMLWMLMHMDYTALIDYMFKELKKEKPGHHSKHVYGPFLNQILLHRVKTICPELTHLTCKDVEYENINAKQVDLYFDDGDHVCFLLIFADEEQENALVCMDTERKICELLRKTSHVEGIIKLRPPRRYASMTYVSEYERMVDLVSRKILRWVMAKNK